MKKGNLLGAFVNDPTPPLPPPVAAASQALPPGNAGKVPRRLQSVVPFRLSNDDHRALKRLAAHDETSMQTMLFEAIKEYAARRGVKLQG